VTSPGSRYSTPSATFNMPGSMHFGDARAAWAIRVAPSKGTRYPIVRRLNGLPTVDRKRSLRIPRISARNARSPGCMRPWLRSCQSFGSGNSPTTRRTQAMRKRRATAIALCALLTLAPTNPMFAIETTPRKATPSVPTAPKNPLSLAGRPRGGCLPGKAAGGQPAVAQHPQECGCRAHGEGVQTRNRNRR
jgi:hypothetical protein